MRRIAFFLPFLLMAIGCGSRGEVLPEAERTPVEERIRDLEVRLPVVEDSVRFAVMGDTGTGDREQYEVGRLMADYHLKYPFEFVLLLGDNLYGGEDVDDYVEKFELPYKELLSRDVKFYASLGNHDEPSQRHYKLFNMKGERYYTFTKGPARFFALDTDYLDPEQVEWLEKELASSNSKWKIAFFHHPLYSSGGRHGPDDELREVLEPLFLKHGVGVVFSGHDHFYERLHPQKGIYYFVSGAGGKLRRGNIRRTGNTAAGFDQDYSFMLVEIAEQEMFIQTVSRTRRTVDTARLPLLSRE